jgi:hypothetical protein
MALSLGSSGCVTRALLTLGDPDDPPARYDRLSRATGSLYVHYDAILHEGEVRDGADDDEEVHLALLDWRSVEPGAIDAACTPDAWAAMTDETLVDVPMLTSRPLDVKEGAAVHQTFATGTPPLSAQFAGTDFRVFCGRGSGVAYADVTHPPPRTGKPPGAVAAIVILFPFALVADVCGGFIGYFASK